MKSHDFTLNPILGQEIKKIGVDFPFNRIVIFILTIIMGKKQLILERRCEDVKLIQKSS